VEELLLLAVECAWGCGVRQSEMHTAKPFVSEPSVFEDGVAVGKV
jgi:hypothetical protein